MELNFGCEICEKKFSTSSNLLRHRATHSTTRSHSCPYCQRHFLRSDSVLRHTRVCASKREQPLPGKALPGRRRTACDRCARSKLSCDREKPCESCMKHGSICSYERLSASTTAPIPDDQLEHSSIGQPSTSPHEVLLGAQHEHLAITNVDGHSRPPDTRHILQARLHQLSSGLVLCQHNLQDETSKIVRLDEHTIRTLFTVTNFENAKDTIFVKEHPTFPLVHRPTFDPAMCTLPLLLSVFVGGHIINHPGDLSPEATGTDWIRLFEEYVFTEGNFPALKAMQPASDAEQRQKDLETIIAAISIAWIQMGSGSSHTRWRMHYQRLPTILEAARSIELFNSGHISIPEAPTESDWRRWITEEMAIRTSAYLFFLDCELATFYQVFPHIALSEMSSAVPSTESLYSARDYDAWQRQIAFVVGKEIPPLRTVVSDLMNPNLSLTTMLWADYISIHGLLQVLCALHHIIYTSRANLTLSHTRAVLQSALASWRMIWDGKTIGSPAPIDNVSEAQYAKFGTEFYCLARAFLDPVETYMETANADSLAQIHDLLRL